MKKIKDTYEVVLPMVTPRHAMWPIIVYFHIDDSKRNVSLSGFEDGKILVMPAIALVYIIESYNKAQLDEMVDVLTTAVSFVSGTYGLSATTKFGKIYAALSLFTSVNDVVLNDPQLRANAIKLTNSESFINSLEQINTFIKSGVSLAKIYTNHYDVLDALADGYEIMKKKNLVMVGNGMLTEEEFQKIEVLYKEIRSRQ